MISLITASEPTQSRLPKRKVETLTLIKDKIKKIETAIFSSFLI